MLALQAVAGNSAVARLLQPALQRKTEKPVPLKAPAEPVLDAWDVKLEPTPRPHQGAGKPRVIKSSLKEGKPKVFVGDTVIVRAHVKHLDDKTFRTLQTNARLTGGVAMGDTEREGTEVLRWRLTFQAPGPATADFDVALAPKSPLDNTLNAPGHSVSFLVVQDIEHFALSCISAQSKLLSKFMAASERLNLSANALRIAYNEQKADLEDVAASEKLADDILFGVIFAAVGGGAGGLLGGWLKTVSGGKLAKADHIIDAGKDTLKFVVRSGQKAIPGGARVSTSGDSTAPTTDQLPTLRGDRAPTGEDPVEFLTRVGARVSAEGKNVQELLSVIVDKARKGGADEFDEDPESVLANVGQLEAIATQLPIEKGAYLKELWKTWLENYAYKASGGVVYDKVARKLRKKINKAADSVGEDGDDWIRHYAPAAKLKAEKEAESQEKFTGGTFGYG